MGIEEQRGEPAGDERDHLASINGVGSTSADALYRIGLRRFADLAQYTPERLAQALREQAGVKISPKRIAAENWIGQAKALMSALHTPSMEEGAMEQEPGNVLGDSNWRQHAGFSLFFDTVTPNEGSPTWQTRLYHDETGNEALLPGIDTTAWVTWIIERAELPDIANAPSIAPDFRAPPPDLNTAAPSALTAPYNAQIEILDIQVFEALTTPPEKTEKRLIAETRFQISGAEAEAITKKGISFRVEVHAIDLNDEASQLLAVQHGQLQPQMFEYALQVDFPVPDCGRYELHTLVLLLPPGEMMTYYQGPNLSVVSPS